MLYLTEHSRPNIANAVHELSKVWIELQTFNSERCYIYQIYSEYQ